VICLKKVSAFLRSSCGSPGWIVCQSTMTYIPRAVAMSMIRLASSVNFFGSDAYPPSRAYVDTRITLAFQSWARASSAAPVRQCAYHCVPCVLMPRSWTGLPDAEHSCVPQTWSLPYLWTGVLAWALGPVSAPYAVFTERRPSVAAMASEPRVTQRLREIG